MSLFGSLTSEQFLQEYWQKKPLLVRGALPDLVPPLSPEALAGLACEDEVVSRLILERDGDYLWQLHEGPFVPEDFTTLPPTHWTLLVQEVDRLVPEVAALLDRFRIVPNWRIDDVMVSYAPPHGGVGAHVDNYDVFLIQGLGRRRWRIHHTPVAEETLVPDLDVRMLAGFEADAEWVMEPGDLLYLPPRIPHEGVALDACMTLSIGFRAPSYRDLLTGFLDDLLPQVDPLARYHDPHLTTPPAHPGRLDADALAQVRQVIVDLLTDEAALHEWFGRYVTEPKRGVYPEPPEAAVDASAVRAALAGGAALAHAPAARFAFLEQADGSATLFVAGEAVPLGPALAYAAPLLANHRLLPAAHLQPHLGDEAFLELLVTLLDEGALIGANHPI